MEFALTQTTVAPVYAAPAFQSEMVTQSILGEVLQIRSTQGSWSEVVLADHYGGWIHSLQLLPITPSQAREWTDSELRITRALVTVPDGNGTLYLPCAAALQLVKRTETQWVGQLPDERVVKIPLDQAMQPKTEAPGSLEKVISLAHDFLSTPYLWGGKTRLGIDCSGFVQVVYKAAMNLSLPRNSRAQAQSALLDSCRQDPCRIGAGHLYFFSDGTHSQISHVAISLSNGRFIHASGCVRISSLNPRHPEYDESLLRRFVLTRAVKDFIRP